MDNPDPQQAGNPDPDTEAGVIATPEAPKVEIVTPAAIEPTEVPEAKPPASEEFNWKAKLGDDVANSPTMKKFDDNQKGMQDAVKSYLSLEKLLGHDKVPVPKGKDDTAAWETLNTALGVPEKPEGYSLPDVDMPDSMKDITFDKAKFQEIAYENKLTPEVTKNLWMTYTDMQKQGFAQVTKQREDAMTGLVNEMRSEWGDAYKSKVELGQMVLNKFAKDPDENDYLTATLSADPRGIKFLAKIGDQFTENKIGDFKYQRQSVTPQEAQAEIDSIRRDSSHPYNNEKATQAERDAAIDHVNSLYASIKKPKG